MKGALMMPRMMEAVPLCGYDRGSRLDGRERLVGCKRSLKKEGVSGRLRL